MSHNKNKFIKLFGLKNFFYSLYNSGNSKKKKIKKKNSFIHAYEGIEETLKLFLNWI